MLPLNQLAFVKNDGARLISILTQCNISTAEICQICTIKRLYCIDDMPDRISRIPSGLLNWPIAGMGIK